MILRPFLLYAIKQTEWFVRSVVGWFAPQGERGTGASNAMGADSNHTVRGRREDVLDSIQLRALEPYTRPALLPTWARSI